MCNNKKWEKTGGFFMYKVVIIDDEPIIVEGLSRLLPWKNITAGLQPQPAIRKRRVGSDTQGEAGHPFFRYLHAGTDGLSMIAARK